MYNRVKEGLWYRFKPFVNQYIVNREKKKLENNSWGMIIRRTRINLLIYIYQYFMCIRNCN